MWAADHKLAVFPVEGVYLTVEILGAIVQDAKERNTLTSVRLATACLLTFAGFLRFDEVANIQLCDLQIGTNHLTIKIPKAKQTSSEMEMIARTGTDTCPVAMLKCYIRQVGIV